MNFTRGGYKEKIWDHDAGGFLVKEPGVVAGATDSCVNLLYLD